MVRTALPSRDTLSLSGVALAFGIGQHMIRPVIAPHAVALGADVTVTGLIVAVAALGGFFVAVPVGASMDRLGGRRVMLVGTFVFIVGAALMVSATTPLVLGAGHMLFGLGGAGLWTCAQALATVAADDDAARRSIAWVTTSALGGQLAGPPIGGVLADTLGARAPFVAAVVAGVILIGATAGVTHARRAPRVSPDPDGLPDELSQPVVPDTRVRALLSRGVLMAALIASALSMSLQTIRQSFLPLYLDELAWSATGIGVVLSIGGLGAVLARVAFTWLDKRVPTPWQLALCMFPGAIALVIAVSTPYVPVVILAIFVSGFSLGLAQPVTLLITARVTAAEERGRAVGLRVTGNRAAQFLGPVLFGATAGAVGLVGGFWLVAGIASAGGVFITRASRRQEALNS